MASPTPFPANIKAILFDHDGTLVDSERVHYEFWAQVLHGHGCELSAEDYINQCVGVSEIRTAEIFKAQFNLNASVVTLVEQKRRVAEAFHRDQHYPLMPGVAATLGRLAATPLTLAVVSGSAAFALEASLTALGLRDLFACVASGENVPHNKPAPDVYQLAMQRLNLAPEQCMAIEDTASGLQAAKAAGVFTCVIPNSYSAHHDLSLADNRFSTMSDWLAWFEARV
ncbi:HAD family phosphatase [Simiduia sp. 21SJ11W-1]|uniref:HAD family hydrolase n=1 Tax=Simiduia sp. 21SJ11W-1 TaxID=2909669 RepID=UPI00209F1123|nr:HAD family phosphatase [Simiduia sp. 21SJ11W-1]UTA46487.1 HAD family phosphatase [Simiduia sp. 21SJ11W-1]